MKNIINFFLPIYVIENQGKPKQQDIKTNDKKKFVDELGLITSLLLIFLCLMVFVIIPAILLYKI